jgi:xylose isomerase
MLGRRIATRINSFASGAAGYWQGNSKPSLAQLVARAATVECLTELDLNYPDHVANAPADVGVMIVDNRLTVSGLAMRYYGNPGSNAVPLPTPTRRSGVRP